MSGRRRFCAVAAVLLLHGVVAATPARAAAPGGEAAAQAALAGLPEPLRRGVSVRLRPDRICPAGDPLAGVGVDEARGRIELCLPDGGGDGGGARPGASGDEGIARQVTFGAVWLFDARAGWSRAPGWTRLNGWSRDLARPWRLRAGNQAPGAFAAPSGQLSPARDLASFAAAWIAERQSAPAAERVEAPAGSLGCRLLPQARYLHARLSALGPLPEALRPAPRCGPFERWAARERLDQVELVLASPSTVTMASLFGHVFLRLVRDPDAPAALALEDPTFAFLVESARPVSEERFYAWKGITGAYAATLVERSLLEAYRTYVVLEGRDLRRFHLRLSPAETLALLERLWALGQASRYRYYFFSTNCATLMVDLVNSVLPEHRQVRYPRAPFTTPAGTLEGYAGTAAWDGGPLARLIPATLVSFEHEARRAARERPPLARATIAAAPPAARPHLEAAFAAISGGGTAERAAAYRTVVAVGGGSGGAGVPALRRYLRLSALVETHLSALANLEAEQVRLRANRERLRDRRDLLRARFAPPGAAGPCAATLRAGVAALASDEADRRAEGYRALRAGLAAGCPVAPEAQSDLRRLALLEAEVRYEVADLAPEVRDALLFPERGRTLAEQPYAADLVALIDYPFVTRLAPPLLALLAARADLARAWPEASSPDGLARQEAARARTEEVARDAEAVDHTGIDELELGLGLGSGVGAPAVLLGGTLHDERLGDQRRFGFPAHTALTVLRSRIALRRAGRAVAVGDWQARLAGYRSLRPRLDLDGRARRVGGEVHADLAGAAGALAARLGGGWLFPLWASPTLASHLLASIGPVAAFDRQREPATGAARARLGLGAVAALEARLHLPTRVPGGWLVARVELQPLATTRGAALEPAASVEAHLPLYQGLRLPLGTGPRTLGLRLRGSLTAPASVLPTRQAGLTLALE